MFLGDIERVQRHEIKRPLSTSQETVYYFHRFLKDTSS